MRSKRQSPWGSEQQAYAIGPRGPLVAVAAQGPMSPTGSRGSLGKFIERSTSAPPPSGHHAAKHDIPYDDSLDLIELMSSAYTDLDGGVVAKNGEYYLMGADNSSGRSTAPTTSSSPFLQSGFARPLSASGEEVTEPFFTTFAAPTVGLVRSQSAAPTMHGLAPPPGLHLTSNQSDSFGAMPLGRRRSSSAGLLDRQTALRPSAKTLMDLIQEDFPNDTAPQAEVYYEQQQIDSSFECRSSSPAAPRHSYGKGGYEVEPQNRVYYRPAPYNETTTQFQMDSVDHHSHYRRPPSAHDDRSYQSQEYSMSSSSSIDPLRGQDCPQDRVIYAQMSQPMLRQPNHHVAVTEQNVYYSNGRGMQGGGMHQPQMMQPGGHQTVYLNGPQGNYSYATIQYQSSPQQQLRHSPQQIIQSIPGQGGAKEQYVSIVPVQGGAPHMTYWPPESQTMGPTVIMNATGPNGTPIAVARVAHVNDMTSSPYGLAGRGGRDKGGRGGRRGNTNGSSRRGTDAKSHAISSPLLDEFRSMKNRDWSIHHIVGHIVEFCQDQNGSRFIQQRLELGDAGEQLVVVKEVLPAIRRLRNDVFGNYVVQKLLDFGSSDVKAAIRDTLEGEMLQLSLQMYGCRVVQKALEAMAEEDLPGLLVEFHHNVLSCIHDQNGNHVIQKCVEVVSRRAKKARAVGNVARAMTLNKQIEFIISDVLVNTTTLSCHPYGCRVLQRILEHCDDERKTDVLDEIKKCHRKLLDDQYGNYVIQHVLQFGRTSDRDSILQIIVEAGLLGLSRQKFASNVVEKLLKYGNGDQRRAVVREMLKKATDQSSSLSPLSTGGSVSVVLLMVRDAYANYVVQTTLDIVPESEERNLLLEELNSHSDELKQYTFAKHIVAKLGTMSPS